MPQIDMHSHIIPAEFPPPSLSRTESWPRVEVAESGQGRVVVSGSVRYNAHELYYDRERRLENMAAHGIDAEVISPLPNLMNYTLPADEGSAYCRALNEYILEVCQADSKRFFGLATLPLQDPDFASKELTALKQSGISGVIVGSSVNGVSIAAERFRGVFQELERLDLPVFVHTITPGPGEHLPQSAALTFGFAAEIALATAGLLTGGIVEACPDLRIAVSHGGGGFALMLARARYFWGRTWNEEPPLEGFGRGPDPAQLARRLWYDALVHDARALRYLVEMLGPSRLMLGSDFPAMSREQPHGKTLRSLGLSDDDVQDIAWRNAFRWLGVSAPAL